MLTFDMPLYRVLSEPSDGAWRHAPLEVADGMCKAQTSMQVLTNAGQANAATGDLGMADAVASQEQLAAELGCAAGDVLIMSTGVIGRRIKLDALQAALPTLAGNLGADAECAQRAAVAITTTGAAPFHLLQALRGPPHMHVRHSMATATPPGGAPISTTHCQHL